MSAGRPCSDLPYPATCLAALGLPASRRDGCSPRSAAAAAAPRSTSGSARASPGSAQDWLAAAPLGVARRRPCASATERVRGKLVDVDADGAIRLEQADGTPGDLLGRRDRPRVSPAATGWLNQASDARTVQPVGRATMRADYGGMLLAIDVGNTNTVFALYRERRAGRAVAPVDQSRAHGRGVRGGTDPADAAQGLSARAGRCGGDLQRGAAGRDRRCAG